MSKEIPVAVPGFIVILLIAYLFLYALIGEPDGVPQELSYIESFTNGSCVPMRDNGLFSGERVYQCNVNGEFEYYYVNCVKYSCNYSVSDYELEPLW